MAQRQQKRLAHAASVKADEATGLQADDAPLE